MGQVVLRAAVALALGLGAAALADDTKPPAKEPPPKPPSFAGYVFVADTVGEVVKADDKSVTLRITWFEQQVKNNNNNNNNNRNRRPNLSGNNRNFRNPFAPNMNRPRQPQVQIKEQHHDYVLEYLPQSLVRTKAPPPKFDDKGKKVAYTQKELEELRAPAGVAGYAAERSEVVPGTYLEVYLIRDKNIAAAKATEDDLRIKHALILGKDPNPPKDITSADKKDEKKKKN